MRPPAALGPATAELERLRREAMLNVELIRALRLAKDRNGELSRQHAVLMAQTSAELHGCVTALMSLMDASDDSDIARPASDDAIIERRLRGLEEMSGDLADYSAARSGTLILAREHVNLRHWLLRFEGWCEATGSADSGPLQVEMASNLPERVITDPARLHKILAYLVDERVAAARGIQGMALHVASASTPAGGFQSDSPDQCKVIFSLRRENSGMARETYAIIAQANMGLRAALSEVLCEIMGAATFSSLTVPMQISPDPARTADSRRTGPDPRASTEFHRGRPTSSRSPPHGERSVRLPREAAIDFLYLDRQLGSLASEILERTAPAFIARAAGRMADLSVAHDLQDLGWMRSVAHAWKASAMVVGAQRLASQLDAIEKQASAGQRAGDGQIRKVRNSLELLLHELEHRSAGASGVEQDSGTSVVQSEAPPLPRLREIVLVESESDQAVYWSALLARAGFHVLTAASLATANDLLATATATATAGAPAPAPRIVICGSVVTDGRGIDFFAALGRRKERALDYLILLTSNFGEDEVIESLRVGANDCLDKGASYGEVRARLGLAERMISLNEALREKNAQFGDALTVIQTELQSAARLQAAILPKALDARGVEFRTLYRPRETLGGDMLGLAVVDEERIAFGLIDIAGHGTASALISCSVIREMMDRMVVLLQDGSGEAAETCGRLVIEELNRRYCRLDIPGFYFTALAGVLDTRQRTVGYCQAGHPSLMSFDTDRGWTILENSGYPVGLLADAEYGQTRIDLAPGQTLLAISDGFLRPQADDPGGSLELLQVLGQSLCTSQSIIARLADFATQAQADQRDDQSAMLIFSCAGPAD
jgi:sigma-B regulation protein RsbU (phosphoserine phosphatase)